MTFRVRRDFSDFSYLQNCWRRLLPALPIMHGTMSNTRIVSLLPLLLPILQLLVAQEAVAAANEGLLDPSTQDRCYSDVDPTYEKRYGVDVVWQNPLHPKRVIFMAQAAVTAANQGLHPSSSQPCSLRDAAMDPTYEKRYGVYVVWQIPRYPKGVIFMAHGLSAEPLAYFDPGPKCKQCYGLPEYRAMVLEALRREYAVISVKSIGDMYDIFNNSPVEASEDLVLVTRIMKEWLREHSLESLPLAAWGISGGTPLASALTTKLPMRSLVLMIGEELLEVQEMATPSTHPPTMFAYMPNDKSDPCLNITGKDAEAMAVLTERGVRVAETQIWPQPLHPLLFTERILCMSDEMSRKIFAALEAAGWLDGRGFLTVDPRTEDWISVLLEAKALPSCTALGTLCLIKHVYQELRMAFGVHGVSSYVNDAIFSWLDSTMLSSSRGGALAA